MSSLFLQFGDELNKYLEEEDYGLLALIVSLKILILFCIKLQLRVF